MLTTLLTSHIIGAVMTLGVVISAAAALISNKQQQSLYNHAKGIGALTVLQYATGAFLMVTSPDNITRGCISLGVYTAVIVVIEAMLAAKILNKNTAQEKTRS